MLLITPVSVTGLLTSYSTPNEWCALAGTLTATHSVPLSRQTGKNFDRNPTPRAARIYSHAYARSSPVTSLACLERPVLGEWFQVPLHRQERALQVDGERARGNVAMAFVFLLRRRNHGRRGTPCVFSAG